MSFRQTCHSRASGMSVFMLMEKNTVYLHDLVKGQYGRKIAYYDAEVVTENNVLKMVAETIGVFNSNRPVVRYLWRYKNGDQPALYREKTIRDDIVNYVVENHAWEIVRFKNGQTYGEPVLYVGLNQEDSVNEYVDKLNDYMRAAEKARKDIDSGEWTSAVGTGFKAIQMKDGDIPFRIVTPTPLNTYVIYSRYTEEPLLAVQELKDDEGRNYLLCFSETHEYRIQNGNLIGFGNANNEIVYSRLHAFGGIPIIEYPNNQDRISDIELVITMLDAINNMQSNRMDAIEQFVQSWILFNNCEIDEKTFAQMKMQGALVVKSNNGENKADVDVISQELSQSESQVAKDDLWNNILTILAIPNKEGNTGGDTQGAVALRNGWDTSKQAARLKDPYVVSGDRKLAQIALNVIRIKKETIPLSPMDYDVQINHSPLDNLYVKVESLQMLLNAGIHPLNAIKTSGLWGDSEKVYMTSKEYLDAKYKTVNDLEREMAQEQSEFEKQTQIPTDGNALVNG